MNKELKVGQLLIAKDTVYTSLDKSVAAITKGKGYPIIELTKVATYITDDRGIDLAFYNFEVDNFFNTPLNMRTFYFNTGVRSGIPANESHISGAKPIALSKGEVWRNGTKQIPFECDVPDNATFRFACDDPKLPGFEQLLVAEIHNSTLGSKYAYFAVSNGVTAVFNAERYELFDLRGNLFESFTSYDELCAYCKENHWILTNVSGLED